MAIKLHVFLVHGVHAPETHAIATLHLAYTESSLTAFTYTFGDVDITIALYTKLCIGYYYLNNSWYYL